MRKSVPLAMTAALTILSGCGGGEETKRDGNTAEAVEEVKEAGNTTIAAGLEENSRFLQLAKAAGIDATLSGAGPYTVLVADDAAFNKLPAGTVDNWLKAESKPELTSVLRYNVLPGTVLAADIGKAIDNAKGRAQLATVGGETLTATREGGNIVLTDSAGTKATITKADETRANGVVHQVNAVLMPGREEAASGQP